MNRLVLDCSVTMAWCFDTEANTYADRVQERLHEAEAVVPTIWSLEVANVLLVGERRGRITPAETTDFVRLLQSYPLMVDQQTSEHVWDTTLKLARDHRLSSYDAAYLELALRHGLALATLDEALRRAAEQLKIDVLT